MMGIVAGAGYFASFQAEAWNRVDGVTIAGVVDPDVERARSFAERWSIGRIYASLVDAIEAERPDFIDIATRPESHLALTRIAADRGVAVICQKPMAPTLGECLAMVECCERAGVRLIIHENWRWQPWYREARRLLDSGAIGKPFYLGFVVRTGDGRGDAPYAVQPYFRTMERLLVYESLVHYLDTMRYLGGEFEELYCRLGRVNLAITGEDCALIDARMTGGIAGVVDANRISGAGTPELAFGIMRFEGDEGMLRMDTQGNLFVTRYGETERSHAYEKPPTGYRGDSVLAVQRHAIECLMSGRPAESEGRDYLKTVEAVEACYRSAASGVVVKLHSRYYDLHGIRVLELMADGAPLRNERDAVEVMSGAMEHHADLLVIPAQRLDDEFFRLRTGIAGQIIQKFLTYGLRLVILGDISEHLQASSALRDFVYECNSGSNVWFVAHLDDLNRRLQQTTAL